MKILKLLLSLTITIGLTYALNTSFGKIPPLGKFLNPFTGFWKNAEPKEVEIADLKFEQLKAPAKVVYDERMIPHLFAQNEHDAVFLQGYVTAKLRLWQMEFQTFGAIGRISELLGAGALNYDKGKRRKGMLYAAEKNVIYWKKEHPEQYKLLEAYRDGINAHINNLKPSQYPIEYKLLDYKPEPWTITKSAIILKLMAEDLANRQYDLEHTNALKLFGKETFDYLYPEKYSDQSPIIEKGASWDFETVSDSLLKALPQKDALGLRRGESSPRTENHIGSNNWAVSPQKSASGNPILCSDPHLQLNLPSIWFELQVQTPERNTYGVSIPGAPFIIIGFNKNIAWGVTNSARDVTDYYVLKWKDKSKQAYLFDGSYRKVQNRIETINIKGGGVVYDTVPYTHFGPAYVEKGHKYEDMALKWLAHKPSTDNIACYKLNRAKNYEDFKAAITYFDCPAQNFAYAGRDKKDIALHTQGDYPLLRDQQGRFIQDGTSSIYQWQGFIPTEHNPKSYNPSRGFVSSANQHPTDSSYPYYYSGSFAAFRGRYINKRLEEMSNVTIADMQALQTDDYSMNAADALPLFLNHIQTDKLNDKEKEALEKIRTWDYVYDYKKVAPAIFETWYDNFYKGTWDEIYALADSIPIRYPKNWRTNVMLRDDADSKFFDDQRTKLIEKPADIVTAAFQKTITKLTGVDGTLKDWQKTKNTKVQHLARLDAFSYDNIAIGGDNTAPNAVSHRHGPSWRMIVELGKDKITAFGCYPGGQSGNPGSPHYNAFLDKWSKKEYYSLNFMQSEKDLPENARIQTIQN